MSDTTHKHTNRLAQEQSPYLQQHAHNPVDWYPWGPEAFAAARSQNKPIFLSVGYSTCYWCHVMERQSFEVEAVAAVMNEKFINIKVDREERPDVDSLYMTAVQVLTRHGGWPMSVWLTPDLRPFYGGTYFPPTGMQGRPGFVDILHGLDDAWQNRRDEVERSATQLANILHQVAHPPKPGRSVTIDQSTVDRIVKNSVANYDPQNGGFGGAPKFPQETLLELLLDDLAHTPDPKKLAMVTHTLDAMAAGGIRDQLGGGFHRYSTDAEWLVPHFEIMLYDNAMLAQIYVEAYRQTEQLRYAHVARGIFEFILRQMTSPDGAFYTAFDAEVDAREGLTYLWTAGEVQQTLTSEPYKGMGVPFDDADATLFLKAYGLADGPNFADPHHGDGVPDSNILFLADSKLVEANAELMERMGRFLYDARLRRKQPMLDTKIITSWNALMVRAFAIGGEVLQEDRYLEAARRGANFLLTHHRTAEGKLLRTSRDGNAKYDGFLDDYAMLAQALLALHEADGREAWKDAAAAIATDMLQRFGDDVDGGFFFTADDATDLIVRQKIAGDSPLPSGNAVAAMVMVDLDHADVARQTIATFAPQIEQIGEGMSSLVLAAAKYVRQHGSIEVHPKPKQQSIPTVATSAANVLTLSTEWRSPVDLMVKISIADGFHINAHEPLKGLVATQLSVTSDSARVDRIDYPAAMLEQFPFAPEPMPVYGGTATIGVRFAEAPASVLQIALQYQACDDRACLPPITKTVDVNPL